MIPGPWLAKVTQWYLRLYELLDRRQQFIERIHKNYGAVVQLAPRTVSINSIKGLQEVYSVTRKFDRAPLPMFYAYESDNLVSTVDAHVHHDRRKPMRRLYTKRSMNSDEMRRLFRDKAKGLVQYCSRESRGAQPVDAKLALQLMIAEVMSEVVYGKRSALNLFTDNERRLRMVANIKSQDQRMISLSSAISAWFPHFVLALRRWKLAPYPLNGVGPNEVLMHDVATMAFEAAVDALSQDKPLEDVSLMETLVNNYSQQLTREKTNYIFSECHDHFWAGVTTTADALLALMFHLSLPKNLDKQRRLYKELSDYTSGSGTSELKYLDHIIKESLRLSPPIIGSLDRITTEPITVEGTNIPSGTEIGAQGYSLHRNAEVFPEPDECQPERWEVDSGSEEYRAMNRHLFAFGQGARMCIGMNMAYEMMRHAVAAVYSTIRTTLPAELVAEPSEPASVQEEKLKKWIRADKCPMQFEVLR